MTYILNQLVVKGSVSEIERFQGYLAGPNGVLDFNNVIPIEDGKSEVEEKAARTSDWNNPDNAMDVQVSSEQGKLVYSYFTSKNPPAKVLEMASWTFDELDFEMAWCELDSVYTGKGIIKNGEGDYVQPEDGTLLAKEIAMRILLERAD